MSDPTTDNKTADLLSQILKELETGGVDAAEIALIAAYPWLGWPIIKQLLEFILTQAADLIYRQAAIATTKLVIDIQVKMEESSVITSFQNLQMAIAGGDPNVIKTASADLSAAYGAIIHSDGWSTP